MLEPSTIAVGADLNAGVLTIRAKGFLTEQQLLAVMDSIRTHDRAIRMRHGRVKVKLLALGGIVQAVVTMKRAESMVSSVARPEDRIALVVGSSLLRMQLRRLLKGPTTEAFTREKDADAWLLSN